MTSLKWDWLGSVLGLVGAFLLALNTAVSGFGWVAFMASNAAWIAYGCRTRTWSLVTMQIGFTATSMLGIWRWLM